MKDVPVLPAEENIVSALSPVQHCDSGFYDLGQKCVSVEKFEYSKLFARPLCRDLHNGDIVSDLDESTHIGLESIMQAHSHFGLERWVL